MSHGSGISVSQQLSEAFGTNLNSNQYRFFKVEIENETDLVEKYSQTIGGSWEDDFAGIQSQLEATEPCYILYRLDTSNSLGFEWALFTYVPDKAKVRRKMLYSSSKASLKMGLGGGRFSVEIHGTTPSDFVLASYKKYIEHQQAEAPLTRAEVERKEEEESGVFVGGGGTGTAANSGVAFPVDDAVIKALAGLKNESHNYVSIIIDVKAEKVILGTTCSTSMDEVGGKFPIDEPRFHFFTWVHDHEGHTLKYHLFIYSCPDSSGGTKSAPVRQRMLYSSSKAHVLDIATKSGLEISGKFEVNNGGEFTEDMVANELHPKPAEEKKSFSRPKAAGRGPRKLLK